MSDGAIAGIVLGVVGMLLVVALLVVCFFRAMNQQPVTAGPMAQVQPETNIPIQQLQLGPYDLRPYDGVNPVFNGGINGVMVCICFILNTLTG